MGNGNGNGDARYGLVDDVVDLKKMIALWDARQAELEAELRACLAEFRAGLVDLRTTLSQMMVVLQACCDKLVVNDQRFERDEGNLDKVQARLKALEVVVAAWKK
jgi:hypothetical protein